MPFLMIDVFQAGAESATAAPAAAVAMPRAVRRLQHDGIRYVYTRQHTALEDCPISGSGSGHAVRHAAFTAR